MGVVYYANYLVWFEIGRTDWLRDTGATYRVLEEEGLGLPVIEAHCEYRAGARYDEEIEIRTVARLVTPIRLAFDYQVLRQPDGQLLATGYTVHAAIDRTGRPVRLPERVRNLFA